MDVSTIGNEFTWIRDKIGSDNAYEKLNRVLMQPQILHWYPNLCQKKKKHALTLPTRQILIKLTNNDKGRAQPFQLKWCGQGRKNMRALWMNRGELILQDPMGIIKPKNPDYQKIQRIRVKYVSGTFLDKLKIRSKSNKAYKNLQLATKQAPLFPRNRPFSKSRPNY